jgi:putative transposase
MVLRDKGLPGWHQVWYNKRIYFCPSLGSEKGTAMKQHPFNPDMYHRHSVGHPTHDYRSTGAYFVTIRAAQSEPVFDLPELRAIVQETWEGLPSRYPGITLDEFIIMSDHIHFVIWLDLSQDHPPTLADVIRVFKSLTTVTWIKHVKATNLNWSGPLWPGGYHDRVIRDTAELAQKRHYIRDIPRRLAAKLAAQTKTTPPTLSPIRGIP